MVGLLLAALLFCSVAAAGSLRDVEARKEERRGSPVVAMEPLNRQVGVSDDYSAGAGAGAVVEKSGKSGVCAARRFHSMRLLMCREQGALGM